MSIDEVIAGIDDTKVSINIGPVRTAYIITQELRDEIVKILNNERDRPYRVYEAVMTLGRDEKARMFLAVGDMKDPIEVLTQVDGPCTVRLKREQR